MAASQSGRANCPLIECAQYTKVLWCGTGCDMVKSCDVNDTYNDNYNTQIRLARLKPH